MKQVMYIAFNNIVKSKAKSILIVVLIGISMMMMAISYKFAESVKYSINNTTDEVNATSKLKITSKIVGNPISFATISAIENVDGVKKVLPDYNISGLLEEEVGVPIYNVSINGFDFENDIFLGAEDYRENKQSGILLPDISYELGDRIIDLNEYVGKEIQITYFCTSNNVNTGKTLKCKVFGTYSTSGTFEENPVYMSMDLFSDILSNIDNMTGVTSARVYLQNAEYTERIAKTLNDYGLEVCFETTIEDYLNMLKGVSKFTATISTIVILLSVIIITQSVNNNIRRRSSTIGVLKAYGYSDILVCLMIWIEVAIYCIAGMVLSYIMCITLDRYINKIFVLFMSNTAFEIDLSIAVIFIIVFGVVLLAASVIPVKKMLKFNPIDVLKSE